MNRRASQARFRQSGLTLVELMIAIALGLLVLLVATGLLLSVKAAYIAQDQTEQIQETARYAAQILARAIRQAGYEYRDAEQPAFAADAELSANVAGMDAINLKKSGAALTSATTSEVVNGSDILGEYAASAPLGIRRYRYAGYPLTYADVTGAEVHNDGEIYAAIVWRMIELFGANRRDDLFRYVVDGMNFTPATPASKRPRPKA